MFFYLSKIFWLMAAPLNLMLLVMVAGLALGFAGRKVWGWRLLATGAMMLVMLSALPIGPLMIAALEQRIAQAPAEMPAPTGILVLGGGIDEALTFERNSIALTEAGVRMSDAVALARRFPAARLVFSGGSAALTNKNVSESDAARLMWTQLGIAPERMSFEDKSRNTAENAEFTRKLVQPKLGETWLLVTSAYHMPRSLGIFRQVGFDVVPFPVDYRTHPWPGVLRANGGPVHNLLLLDTAMREWIGLVVYFVSGRSNALFPGP